MSNEMNFKDFVRLGLPDDDPQNSRAANWGDIVQGMEVIEEDIGTKLIELAESSKKNFEYLIKFQAFVIKLLSESTNIPANKLMEMFEGWKAQEAKCAEDVTSDAETDAE